MMLHVPALQAQQLLAWIAGAQIPPSSPSGSSGPSAPSTGTAEVSATTRAAGPGSDAVRSSAAHFFRADLFGGSEPWITSTLGWKAVDDRVRGGSSHSYFQPLPGSSQARFFGTLDTATLGGAGFASQTTTELGSDETSASPNDYTYPAVSPKEQSRTTPAVSQTWNLSAFDGIELAIARADPKTYTFIVKDHLPSEQRPDGREQASINWEFDFKVEPPHPPSVSANIRPLPACTTVIRIPWSAFKPTYRGREKHGIAPLQPATIKRFTLMMRSFFEEQRGAFEMEICAISAYRRQS